MNVGKTKAWQILSILKLIYQYPGITRKELSLHLDTDRAMITHILNYLIENEWIEKQDPYSKNLPLTLIKDRIFAAGIEIQPEYQVRVITNLEGEIIFEEYTTHTIISIECYLEEHVYPWITQQKIPLCGLTVALPGIYNSAENKLLRSQPFNLRDPVIFPRLIPCTDIPLFIDNDVRCWGWGKVAFEKQFEDFLVLLFIFIEDNCSSDMYKRITNGAAFFSNGKARIGAHGCSGELPGFFRIDEYRSTSSYIPYDKRLKMKSLPQVYSKWLNQTAATASYLATVFDSQKMYISGSTNIDSDLFTEKISSFLSQYQFYPEIQNIEVLWEPFKSSATAQGASGFVFENLFVLSLENGSANNSLLKVEK
ncbi:MAG TPA: MarR family transcriptional regulator [Treponemataceae bacterium]|nr:MarR family transcriptional regulator [Treponemataceae bacterium]